MENSGFSQLPKELTLKILSYLPICDLQSLLKVSRGFRKFAQDSVLWKEILLKRNPLLISHKLERLERPTRIQLLERNIITTATTQSIMQGEYINGPIRVKAFHVGKQLAKSRRRRHLANILHSRPSREELGKRNLIPTATVSPALYHNVKALELKFREINLKTCLNQRQSVDELSSIGVSNNHQLSKYLIPALTQLEKGLKRKSLFGNLKNRKQISYLDAEKIIGPESYFAGIICPGVKTIINFYEAIESVQ